MKKIAVLLLALLTLFTFTACESGPSIPLEELPDEGLVEKDTFWNRYLSFKLPAEAGYALTTDSSGTVLAPATANGDSIRVITEDMDPDFAANTKEGVEKMLADAELENFSLSAFSAEPIGETPAFTFSYTCTVEGKTLYVTSILLACEKQVTITFTSLTGDTVFADSIASVKAN